MFRWESLNVTRTVGLIVEHQHRVVVLYTLARVGRRKAMLRLLTYCGVLPRFPILGI